MEVPSYLSALPLQAPSLLHVPTSSPQAWYLAIETQAMTNHHQLLCSINELENIQRKGSFVHIFPICL